MALPRRFGRYLLVEKLATGGMAEIFEARLLGVEGFEKPLAIKQILPHWSEKKDFVAMLIDEAKIVVRLNHPNIVQVYELGQEEGQYYIAMELIDGVDLRELVKAAALSGKPLSLPLVLGIIREISQALVYAHPLEIIHRDISPQNILLSYEGQVKVTDFGIAKAADRQHETVTGTFKGKFAYMSPEQANQQNVDQRSDLFSLGILFYELACGRRLFGGPSDVSVLDKVRRAEIPQDDPHFKKLPEPVRELILELLAKDPQKRPESASVIRDRIKQIMLDLGMSCDAQDLSRFVRDVLADKIAQRRTERTRVSEQVAAFREQSQSQRQETQTAIPDVAPRPDATRVLVRDWKQSVDSTVWWRPLFRERRWMWGVVGAIAVIFVVALFVRETPDSLVEKEPPAKLEEKRRTPPEVQLESPKPLAEPKLKPEQAVTADIKVEAVREKKIEPTTKKAEPAKPVAGFGRLNVQAVPWGYVYAGAAKRRYETPVTGLKLPSGSQLVRVVYPPNGAQLQRQVDIRPGKSITCIARFGAKKGLSCH